MAYLLRALGLFFMIYAGKPVVDTLIGLIQTHLNYPIGLATCINIILLAGGIGLLMLREWARKVLRYGCIGMIIIQVVQVAMSMKFNWNIVSPVVYNAIIISVLSMPQAEASTID